MQKTRIVVKAFAFAASLLTAGLFASQVLAQEANVQTFTCEPGARTVVKVPFNADTVKVTNNGCLCASHPDYVKELAGRYVTALIENNVEVVNTIEEAQETKEFWPGESMGFSCYKFSDLRRFAEENKH